MFKLSVIIVPSWRWPLSLSTVCSTVKISPVDVSNGSVDCDSRTAIIRPQNIRWENVVIIHHSMDISLSPIH